MYEVDHAYSAAAVAKHVRILPHALAHALANEKPASLRVAVLNSLFNRLSPADKLRCQAELNRTREAKRVVLNRNDVFGRLEGEASVISMENWLSHKIVEEEGTLT